MKLGRKDYTISVKTGTDANKAKFKKECVQGEIYHATDTGFFYIAEVTAGLNDATLSQFGATPFSNTKSVSFDGSDDMITIPQGTFNLGSGLFSFSLWFNADSLNSFNGFFNISSSTSLKLTAFMSSGGDIYCSNWGHDNIIASGNTINTGTWYHLAIVKSTTGSAGIFKLYLNGNLLTTNPPNGIMLQGSTFGSENSTSTIGKTYDATWPYPFNGKIDEFAFWNSALSASDISTLRGGASAGTVGVPADISSLNPVGWWRMGDGSDGSGNADGTVVGGLPQIYNVATDGSGNRITGIDGSLTNIASPNGIVSDVP